MPNHHRAREALAALRELTWPTTPNPIHLPFAPKAAELIQEWREQVARMEEGETGRFLAWLGKLPGFALRLATILAHLEKPEPSEIGELPMLRALTLIEAYGVPMARRVFGEAALPEAERDARRLAKWIIQQSPVPGIVIARELRPMANGPGISDAQRTEAALKELAAAGWVRRAPSGASGIGRQRSDWAVNPKLGAAQ